MKHINELSDDDIDALLLRLFNEKPRPVPPSYTMRISDLSHNDLLRIRSKNHPDKSPNVNQAVYQAAVEELDRRRRLAEKT